jgi:hypothetical protein
MPIACTVSSDDGLEARKMMLAVAPRVGETISVAGDGQPKDYRVRQVTHSDVEDASSPSIAIQVTTQLL